MCIISYDKEIVIGLLQITNRNNINTLDNLGDVSDEQGESFHQEIDIMQKTVFKKMGQKNGSSWLLELKMAHIY